MNITATVTFRERAALTCAAVTAAAAAAAAAIAVAYGRQQQRKAARLSQAEINELIAGAETELALDDQVDDTTLSSVTLLFEHETPPQPHKPWFWYVAVAGGRDPVFGVRGVRSGQGYEITRRAAHERVHDALHTLTAPETDEDEDTHFP